MFVRKVCKVHKVRKEFPSLLGGVHAVRGGSSSPSHCGFQATYIRCHFQKNLYVCAFI